MKNKTENKERIIILIDGSNFYYSTAKKGKKIDFEKLIEEFNLFGKIQIYHKKSYPEYYSDS